MHPMTEIKLLIRDSSDLRIKYVSVTLHVYNLQDYVNHMFKRP
jgi:hypothetical protein